MRYAMLLKSHSNVRYFLSLQKLALCELSCALSAWELADAKAELCRIAGESFLTFETDAMTQEMWRDLSCLSSICLAGELEGELLRPIPRHKEAFVPEELPQVLKYKGKTNADFTALMLHCAKNASAFARSQEPLTVLDPLCGKATTLFCALCQGHNAVGVERDDKALREADVYLERFLKLNKLKHKREQTSRTLPSGGSVKVVCYELSNSPERWKAGDTRSLSMVYGDAQRLGELVKPASCHLIVTDMPDGVQHAPHEGRGTSTLARLAEMLARGCARALKQGGAAAVSFNAYTLQKDELAQAMRDAGLKPLTQPPYDDFSHWVEQAVTRDLLIATKE